MLFRYPGGKSRMVDLIVGKIAMICGGGLNFSDYSEPFVGGGSVALEIARKTDAYLWFNDDDFWITALWDVIADYDKADFTALCEKVFEPVTISLFWARREIFKPQCYEQRRFSSRLDAAYNALFFNRTTFSGILSAGPIGGKTQSSAYKVNCRWNPKRLLDDLMEARNLLAGRTTVTCLDWRAHLDYLPKGTFAYLDPPYLEIGNTLYPQVWTNDDHVALRDYIYELVDPWILSYNNLPGVHDLYKHFCSIIPVEHYRSMSGRRKTPRPRDKSELLIYRKQ